MLIKAEFNNVRQPAVAPPPKRLYVSRRPLRKGGQYPHHGTWLEGGPWRADTALTGHSNEARETLRRYLSLREARTKTIAAFKKQANSDNASYLAMRERLCKGLRKAGLPEERVGQQ